MKADFKLNTDFEQTCPFNFWKCYHLSSKLGQGAFQNSNSLKLGVTTKCHQEYFRHSLISSLYFLISSFN